MLIVLGVVTLAWLAARVSLDMREGERCGRSLARRTGEAGAVWLVVWVWVG